MSMYARADLKQAYQVTAILCTALIVGLFVYAGAVELIRLHNRAFDGFLPPVMVELLRYVVYTLATVQLVLAGVIKHWLGAIKRREEALALLGRLKVAVLAAYALSEIPALLGLVLFLLAGLHTDFYILWLMSLVAMLVHFPRLRMWEDLARTAARPA
jgi:hypothetical protein